MKNLIGSSIGVAAACALLSFNAAAGAPEPGYVDFGKLTASPNGEFVEVNIGTGLVSMVTRLAKDKEPQVAEVLRGLKQIRVNVIGLDEENRKEIETKVRSLRSELSGAGWERIVTVQQKGEDVGVYLKMRGEEAVEGLVVTVLQGHREAVLINVVGDIRPEKLAMLGERFNIEPLKQVGQKLEQKP